MATPQAGNQHDTFELERVFTEFCDLLEAAELRLDGLFLNADKAFGVTALRQACARRGIEANIPRNRRSADWQTDDDIPNSTAGGCSLSASMPGLTGSRPCSYAMKPPCKIG